MAAAAPEGQHRFYRGVGFAHEAWVRSRAGSPAGAVTPNAAGEALVDSDAALLYASTGTTSGDWAAAMTTAPASSLAPVRCLPSLSRPNSAAPTECLVGYGHLSGALNVAYTGTPAVVHLADRCGGVSPALRLSLASNSAGGSIQLVGRVPVDWAGWYPLGVQVYTRLTTHGGGSGDTVTVTLEALDPDAGGVAFSTPKTAARTATATEATWQASTLSASTLGSGYAAGDLLALSLTLACAPSAGGGAHTLDISDLLLWWR